jgi:hypothetical protein
MKKILILLGASILSISCFAQDPASNPEWLASALAFVSSIPKVGPLLVVAAKWVGFVGAVFTILSTAVEALLLLPEVALRLSKAPEWATKVQKFRNTIVPWLKYFSIYNVQKK